MIKLNVINKILLVKAIWQNVGLIDILKANS